MGQTWGSGGRFLIKRRMTRSQVERAILRERFHTLARTPSDALRHRWYSYRREGSSVAKISEYRNLTGRFALAEV